MIGYCLLYTAPMFDLADSPSPSLGTAPSEGQTGQPLTLAELEAKHPTYLQYSPVWRTLDTLRDGFPAIAKNVERFLPRRPAEDDELYRLRVAKISYTPILDGVVLTYTGKMAEAALEWPAGYDATWDRLRQSNAEEGQPNRNESTLLADLLNEILYYGRLYVLVDVPAQAQTLRSRYELSQSQVQPFFRILKPLSVINWGATTGIGRWFITRDLVQEPIPFAEPETWAIYTYYEPGQTLRYRLKVKLKEATDAEGNKYPEIRQVWYKGEWVQPDKDKLFEPDAQILGAGSERIVASEAGPSGWLCRSIYNKQIQHLRIENAWTDCGYLSGTVQRVFTPNDPAPTDDPRVVYPDSAGLEKAGNAHILVGKAYAFVESSGAALTNLEGMLDKIERQVLKIANLSFASGDKGVLEQSGVSKALDTALLNGILAEYGSMLLSTYNALLKLAAGLLSVDSIEVYGLSDFEGASTDDLISTIAAIGALTDFPAADKQAVYGSLMRLLDL